MVVILFIFAVSMSILIDCNYINNSDNSVTLLTLDPLRPPFLESKHVCGGFQKAIFKTRNGEWGNGNGERGIFKTRNL